MSILLTPYDKSDDESESKEDSINDLMVFGYHCKLYRDDVKAELENSGSLLIPWMGDSSLMVDRYDIRNTFNDKSQFGIKPNLPYHMTAEEEDLEIQLDKERYQSLDTDITEDELQREMEMKQDQSDYNAVPFSYDVKQKPEETNCTNNEQLIEHPPTETVDIVEDETDMYYDPPDLNIPFYIERPYSKKFQLIIERTAKFISTHGQQMEIIIKTKQKHNGRFSFLHHEDRLFPYYKQLLHAILEGSYAPKVEENNNQLEEKQEKVVKSKSEEEELYSKAVMERKKRAKERRKRVAEAEKITEDEVVESDEEETMDLHPLLRTAPLALKTTKPQKDTSLQSMINSAPAVSLEDTTNMKDTVQDEGSTADNNDTTITTTYPGYDIMSAYYHASQMYQTSSSPLPPPPDLQPIVDKTADYVAKNGSEFEKTVIMKHLDDRRFDFLHPWNQYYNYYKTKLEAAREEIERNKPLNLQKLNSLGSVSFKLSNKPVTTLQLPIGVVDLHYEDESELDELANSSKGTIEYENKKIKKQKLSVEGPIDGEFKKFLSTVKTLLS